MGIQFDLWHAARIHGDAAAVGPSRASGHMVRYRGFRRNETGGGGCDLTGVFGFDEGGYRAGLRRNIGHAGDGAWAGLAGGFEGACLG